MSSAFGDIRGRAFWVVLGCLVCQLGLGFGYVFGPLARDIIGDFDWTRAEYSFARTPQLFVTALASPVVGSLVIRYGARGVLAGGAVILGISFVLMSGMQSLWQYYALITLMGLSVTGLGDITVGAAISQWVERGRGLALGLAYSGSNLGGFVLTRIAAGIADESSWREALFTLGLGGVLVILPFALFAIRAPRAGEGASDIAPDPARAVDTEGDLDLRAAVRTRSFWILAASLFTFFFYFLGMLEHLVLFLTDQGVPRDVATGYFSNAILIGILSKVLCGVLADRLPARTTLLLDYGLLAFSSLLLFALPHPVLIVVFVLAYGFATAARDVVYPTIINHCFGVTYLAQIYGALMLALLPGGALGPLFAAALHDALGSYDVAFGGFALLNVLALAALLLVRREKGRDRDIVPA
jgi:MFS family permease